MKTTMAHKGGRAPGGLEHGNLKGHPGSRNVIRTTMSKPSCRADKFVSHKGNCGHIHGSPGTEMQD